MQKYAFDEARPVLERASARETAARVALGRVASAFLEQSVGAAVVSHVVELGGVKLTARLTPGHTRGTTTWTTTVEDGGQSYRVVFAGSTSVNPGTRGRICNSSDDSTDWPLSSAITS